MISYMENDSVFSVYSVVKNYYLMSLTNSDLLSL